MIKFPKHITELECDVVFQECIKKPIPVRVSQIEYEFRVDSIEGDYAQGKPGDYLMCGVRGELYICDKDIFEESYDFTTVSNSTKSE